MGFLKKMLGGNDDQPAPSSGTTKNSRDADDIVANLMQLQPGDSIAYMTHRWEVTGWLDNDEGGYRWREFHLVDAADDRAAISVDPKGTPMVTFWTYNDQIPPVPGAPEVIHDGITFKSNAHGTYQFRAHGKVDAPDNGMIEYYDFQLRDRRRMVAFQRCNNHSWETYKGESVEEEYVSITKKQ